MPDRWPNDNTHHEVWVHHRESGFISRHTYDTPRQAEAAADNFQADPDVDETEIFEVRITLKTKWSRR